MPGMGDISSDIRVKTNKSSAGCAAFLLPSRAVARMQDSLTFTGSSHFAATVRACRLQSTMALPLHVLFEIGSLRDVELVPDNARMHAKSFTSASPKRATRRIARRRRSHRLHGRGGKASPVDRWNSSSSSTTPVNPMKSRREAVAPSSHVGFCKLDETLCHASTLEYLHRLSHTDSSPVKPIRVGCGITEFALKSSLSMPRRPLRKPFVDLAVVQSPGSKRYEGTTADMISMVLEELKLTDDYSDDEDDTTVDDLNVTDRYLVDTVES